MVATFFETDPPTARLERGDQTVTAWLVPAASGSKYEGQNVEFWDEGEGRDGHLAGRRSEVPVEVTPGSPEL